jgi:hypothetical protein
MTFRETYKSDASMRVVDAIGHLGLALLLPGHWWFAYLPDVMLPFVFGVSLAKNKLLDKDNPFLRIHKFLHSELWLAVLCFGIALGMIVTGYRRWIGVWLALHWMCHCQLDLWTHDRWREYEDASEITTTRH